MQPRAKPLRSPKPEGGTMRPRVQVIPLILTLFLVVVACSSFGQNPHQLDSPPADPASAAPAPSPTQPSPSPSGNVINPDALEYLGAFRLPGREDPPRT